MQNSIKRSTNKEKVDHAALGPILTVEKPVEVLLLGPRPVASVTTRSECAPVTSLHVNDGRRPTVLKSPCRTFSPWLRESQCG